MVFNIIPSSNIKQEVQKPDSYSSRTQTLFHFSSLAKINSVVFSAHIFSFSLIFTFSLVFSYFLLDPSPSIFLIVFFWLPCLNAYIWFFFIFHFSFFIFHFSFFPSFTLISFLFFRAYIFFSLFTTYFILPLQHQFSYFSYPNFSNHIISNSFTQGGTDTEKRALGSIFLSPTFTVLTS